MLVYIYMGNILYSYKTCDYCYNRVNYIRYQYNVFRNRLCSCDECYNMISGYKYIHKNDNDEYIYSYVDKYID
jgi:hypothetical protein